MFTVFVMGYLKYADQEMQDFEKKKQTTDTGLLEVWNNTR